MNRSASPIILLALLSSAFAQSSDEFFEKKIRPVLVAKCQVCHNAKAKTAGLDLSTAEGFAHGGPSGPLIAEKPEESRLLKVIGYEDHLKMPPTGKLPAEDIADIAAWVKLGAPWPGAQAITPQATANAPAGSRWSEEQKKFWAFQPIRVPEPPRVHDESWVRSAIDRFVLSKLEEQGLKPAPPASKLTLLRRATFDLTGLPPTEDEIRRFMQDNSPDAYAKVIDRLLSSPRYGERWGRHWLDVARYADSTGNDEDHRYPYAWRYRDYVIDAFNRDLPYNEFVREQLAGDLLPSKNGPVNRDGIVATGFLALGAKALAQQDKQKMLYDIYDEQVDVTTRAFLGLTVACARCHDHKFDPIATKDYYALTGIFASTKDFANPMSNVSQLLYKPLCEDSEYRTYRAYQKTLAAKMRQINDVYDVFIEKRVDTFAPRTADYMIAARSVYQDHRSADDVAAKEHMDPVALKRWVRYLEEGSAGRPHLEAWANATPATMRTVAEQYQAKVLARMAEYEKKLAEWRQAAAKADEARTPAPPKPAPVSAEIDPFFNDVLTRGPFFVADARSKGDDVMNLDKDKERQRKLEEQRKREREYTITREELLTDEAKQRVKALRAEYDEMKKAAPAEPEMADAVEEGKPVEQHVLIRGDYNSPGDVAPKLFPSIVAKPEDPKIESGSGRLQLAEWLTRPDNPLTSRVFVNRLWYWHFGEGLVRTPDNFGKMGERPTHPELLDYLASDFVKQGWSVKKLHRAIMLSNTYQMASTAPETSYEKDPENRLLSRFQRRRLEVEEIRDGMLALDGSLDLTMGGTLQTGFGTDSENSEDRLSLNPEKLTRRTVYLPLRRANLPTLLNLFDFGDATTVNGKRALTTVAPQALFAMNSEFVLERARNLAESVLEHTELTESQRLDRIFMRTLNRPAVADEKDTALSFVRTFEKKFSKTEVEAWQSLCRLLIASNEFIYVD
jgi:cytochrome c553